MSNKQLTHIVGTFLIQAEGAFLNGWGTEGEGEHAITRPKTMVALGTRYDGSVGPVKIPYVAAQSWKRWLRDTFADENPGDNHAIMMTTKINKAGNTIKTGIDPNPVKFSEADIFGFMKTEKEQGKPKEIGTDIGEQEGDEDDDVKGRIKVQPAIRTSPFHASILKSLRNVGWDSIDQAYAHPKVISFLAIESILLDLLKEDKNGKLNIEKKTADELNNILSEARQQASVDKAISVTVDSLNKLKMSQNKDKRKLEEAAGQINSASSTSLGYKTQFYNAQLQGIFGLAYHRLGVFRNEGDRIELSEEYQKAHKKELDKEETNYGVTFKMKGNPRKNRATKILKALSVMRGGAKQAQFGTPVHPQVLILAGLTSGNLIFNNIFEDSPSGPKIKIETLEEVLKDYTPRLASNIYIGIRTGYLESENEKKLRVWAKVKDEQGNENPRHFKHTLKENGHDNELKWNVVICTPLEAASKVSEELPA